MSVIAVKALISKNSEDYKASGALSQFEDSEDISAWAYDFSDIAANYYLVNSRGDKYFSPKEIITRAEAAGTLKKLSDLLEIGTEELSFSVLPSDSSLGEIVYTSSNPDIVEVSQNGRLFPIKSGTAEVTVTINGVSDSCEVRVIPLEDWMIKSIEIDGEKIDNFSPVTRKYKAEVLIGTTDEHQQGVQRKRFT